jgi:simple sugar transport system substrate-binding protein
MIKSRASVIAVALLLSVVACLSACGTTKSARTSISTLVGVSVSNIREPWLLVMMDELQAEADKHPEMRLVVLDAAGNEKKQEEDIDALLSYGIDLLIISPCDPETMTPVVQRVDQKIPVIVLDRMVEGYDYHLFIGPDNVNIGRLAGEKILELAGNGSADILEIQGSEDSLATINRSAGFREITAKHGELHTTSVQVLDESRDMAEDTVYALGNWLKDIDMIFAYNDNMALGACRALERLNINGIKIVSVDGFPGENRGLDLLRQGKISATVTCPTGGKDAIQYALDILGEINGVPKQVILRSHVVTADNVDAFEQNLAKEAEPIQTAIRVGYAMLGTESGWRLANNASIREAAQQEGIKLTAVNADQKQDAQIAAIRRFIAEEMDVIVISPIVSSGYDEALMEARDAGIPVILSDRQIDVSDRGLYLTYIGADMEEEGRRAMNWVLNNVATHADGTPVRILEIQGTPGSSPAVGRKKGFEQTLNGHSGYLLAESLIGASFTKQDGYDAIERYMADHDFDFDVIFSHNDDMALGAADALQGHGIKPGQDVRIISVDGTSAALQALADGRLNCVVECSPLLGPQLMKAIKDLISGKEPPMRIITDEKVFTADNALLEPPGRKY